MFVQNWPVLKVRRLCGQVLGCLCFKCLSSAGQGIFGGLSSPWTLTENSQRQQGKVLCLLGKKSTIIYGEKKSPCIGRGNKSCTRYPSTGRGLVTGGSLNPLAPERECISINVDQPSLLQCRGYNLNPLALARERLYVQQKKNHLTCLRMFVFQVLVLGWIGHIWRVIVSVDPH